MTKMSSWVWQHFTLLKDRREEAKCNHCGVTVSKRGGSTSGLQRHLKFRHGIEQSAEPVPKRECKQQLITSWQLGAKKESLGEILSELACISLIPINAIANDKHIQAYLISKGLSPPKSPGRIMDLIHEHCLKVKEKVKTEIKTSLLSSRLSVSLDEFTSMQNRRFMNINVHLGASKFYHLGLVRMNGAFPAEKCKQLLEEKLEEFGITLNNVVGLVTDGATVMSKLGALVPSEHQLCYAHGIHLAVCDVLYSKPSKEQDNNSSGEDITCDDEDIGAALSRLDVTEDDSIPLPLLKPNIAATIQKVRRLVTLFHRSPGKNDVLQSYVKAEFGQPLKLLRDTKTRWNSLLACLERFVKVHKAISQALLHLSLSNPIEDQDLRLMRGIIAILKPLKIATDALCNRDASLLSAEEILKFVFTELKAQNTSLASELRNALELRILSRRRSTLIGLLNFLHRPESIQNKQVDKAFPMPTKNEVIKLAKVLLGRLCEDNSELDQEEEQNCDNDEHLLSSEDNMKERLAKQIQGATAPYQADSRPHPGTLTKQFSIFELTGERTSSLQLLYNSLLTVPPTSVEAERAFSAAGLFITKLRCRMSDKTVDTLCFLRSYLLSQREVS